MMEKRDLDYNHVDVHSHEAMMRVLVTSGIIFSEGHEGHRCFN